ncbi:ribonuclease R [Litorivivens lipolytica]|uniref:Ribonuclease R n=1 Tax=Litorivivens lipolytica TaxID=1524264 RepID=A0A7W4W5D2_9GAMM|nr:ribonuclease R [Litorivivens lipolytica]MBB3047752.1 ribonuclease R [Litorivivens lipolytica]
MAKRRPPADPHAEREASRYDNPIPSREVILSVLDEKSLTEKQLAKKLNLHDAEAEEALRRRVRAMLRDKQLTASKSGRLEPAALETLEGLVQANKDGFGFVLQEGQDIFLTAWQMQRVFDGDRVRVAIEGYDRRGRAMGNIVQVLERNTRQVVGRFDVQGGEPCVVCEGKVSHVVGLEDLGGATPEIGDYLTVAITRQPEIKKPPLGTVVEVLGDINHPGVATDVAVRQHDIPHEWPEAVEREARRFAAEPSDEDKKARVDLRKLPLVTIDGEDARDFDDAVYCEPKKSGGWRLWVAIADVSHYVKIGSALDDEAQKRATSVYFPDRVVPMLPEALSNGLCSLKPEVERLCMVCEMTISEQGRISGYSFYEAVMRSHARFTYNEVWALLDGKAEPELLERRKGFLPQLRHMHDLYKALRYARDQRGAIDFETVETKVVYDKQHRIAEIVPIQRNDAHKIIEECMLAANVATARLLEKSEMPALFRVHQSPGGDKLGNLRTFLGELGLNLSGGEQPTPVDYQALLQSVADRPDASVIQVMMLRSLKQAMYQPDNGGHFGLHYQAYAHFTSPIRRYPDLLVHRCIRYLLRSNAEISQLAPQKGAKKLKQSEIYPYDMGAMVSLGEHCSMAERRADDASRDVMAWLKCEYLQERVGETFEAIITAVTGFGFFAEMKPLYMEGLVHIGALGKDFYQFDAARQRLVGERNREVFALGDSVTVQILRVDVEDRKVDLGLVAAGTSASGKQRKLSRREQIAKGIFDEGDGKKPPSKGRKGKFDKSRPEKKDSTQKRSGPRKRRKKR